jgi:hypothetical protein
VTHIRRIAAPRSIQGTAYFYALYFASSQGGDAANPGGGVFRMRAGRWRPGIDLLLSRDWPAAVDRTGSKDAGLQRVSSGNRFRLDLP